MWRNVNRLQYKLQYKLQSRNYSKVNILTQSMATLDPEMHEIFELEKQRQRESIVLIPSEVSSN